MRPVYGAVCTFSVAGQCYVCSLLDELIRWFRDPVKDIFLTARLSCCCKFFILADFEPKDLGLKLEKSGNLFLARNENFIMQRGIVTNIYSVKSIIEKISSVQ